MQFSVAISAILSAMAVQTALAATCDVSGKKENCCWGKDNESCQKQNPNNEIWCLNDKANYCSRVMKQGTNTPVSATCDADCCDTVTGWGTGCPK
ncbi:hypothetical protein CGCF415_v002108 [Colletotrichum fructicola]|uniref:Uncharacterized protein n=3 Tax=Colletotrichum gloeosporioides species complex TaxID=2707338 RepID=L2GH42_COLFN|nr:uncharacterized protein CGMCC3_g7381 [Colletotrichum fructicola]XP_045271175.1 uncharacterized protein GCG54_00002968 [Colletotrichum gloeosporioides]XP_053036490.1 uncharacterized protein COL26b_006733 [Colletotrichum chrysophilum]KAF4482582.1 hypothetical protein CGGC5_v009992 [Colletotrichum fructicola Nara gc5]KAF4828400.1 hypothetical protein CGCTS75_v007358 [Colletotrichum tropicale]KAH9234386.1 hypothetical protein K456DRAFT_1723989 [Colletotrichum gloeosporioides 23]KAJ0273967.1 hy